MISFINFNIILQQAIPAAVLGNVLLMNNISFARRHEIPVKWVRVLDITGTNFKILLFLL